MKEVTVEGFTKNDKSEPLKEVTARLDQAKNLMQMYLNDENTYQSKLNALIEHAENYANNIDRYLSLPDESKKNLSEEYFKQQIEGFNKCLGKVIPSLELVLKARTEANGK